MKYRIHYAEEFEEIIDFVLHTTPPLVPYPKTDEFSPKSPTLFL
jgi:hypothetical protein